jgi:uncharacterized protein (TIGR02145 family)
MLKYSTILLPRFISIILILLFISCSNDKTADSKAKIPVLSTIEASEITQTTAESGGSISSDQGLTVMARGVCWSLNATPTVNDDKTIDGAGVGNYVSSMNNLLSGTSYFVRAYATNSAGTGYGSAIWFTTLPATIPILATDTVNAITQTTAICGGNIFSDGSSPIIARGVCWSTDTNPNLTNEKTLNGTGIGSFESVITGLTPSTPYYVCAYATNIAGTGYGDVLPFTSKPDSISEVTDIDGNIYEAVKIGTQWWMAENLRVTHYRTGVEIPKVIGNSEWVNLTTGAYCDYNNDNANASEYGHLYNWYAAYDSNNLAMNGWHVPSDSEWQYLIDYLGGEAIAGGKMKEIGFYHWADPNAGANNESGFTALPGGHRSIGGAFIELSHLGYYWSTTPPYGSDAWYRYLDYNSPVISRSAYYKKVGFSIRCVRD